MPILGQIYTKKVFVVHLKPKFNWATCISSHPTPRRGHHKQPSISLEVYFSPLLLLPLLLLGEKQRLMGWPITAMFMSKGISLPTARAWASRSTEHRKRHLRQTKAHQMPKQLPRPVCPAAVTSILNWGYAVDLTAPLDDPQMTPNRYIFHHHHLWHDRGKHAKEIRFP